MKSIYSAAVVLALLTAPHQEVLAEEPLTKQRASDPSQDDEDVVTCRREDTTGSRVKKRNVCTTERQRREEREKTSNELDDIRMQGTTQRSNGG